MEVGEITEPVAGLKPVATETNEAADLARAAAAIFAGHSVKFHSPTLNREIHIGQGRMNSLPALMEFFGAILSQVDQSDLHAMITAVAQEMKKNMDKGKDAFDFADLKELAATEIATRLLGKLGIGLLIMRAVFQELGGLVAAFSDVDAHEFGLLDWDEGTTLALGIFVVNYSFFTRSVPPIIRAFLQSGARTSKLQSGNANVSAKTAPTVRRAKIK